MMKHLLSRSLLLSLTFAGAAAYAGAGAAQDWNISSNVEIPGATLRPGAYTVSVEDRLKDRAVVRIALANSSEHYLLLAVPSDKAPSSDTGGFAYFTGKDNTSKALRSWKCADCSSPLEFVYPKLEAVKITDASTQPVLAVDPTYDKLPSNLSPDDMKVVTLWLLSPERVTADNQGQGVKAVKFASTQSAESAAIAAGSGSQVAQSEAPKVPGHARKNLPHTASNTYLSLLLGSLFLIGGAVVRFRQLGFARAKMS